MNLIVIKAEKYIFVKFSYPQEDFFIYKFVYNNIKAYRSKNMAIIKKPTKKIIFGLSLFLGLFLILFVKLFGVSSWSLNNFKISLIEKIIGISKVKADVPDSSGDGGSGGGGSGGGADSSGGAGGGSGDGSGDSGGS